jgi:glutamate synthase domain-containing protein 3
MSGGIAYVLDEQGDFAARCNTQLVGLEALEAEDEAAVIELLEEHAERTGSPVAARLLAEWDPVQFVKVIPHDYRRALAELGDEVRYQDQPMSAGGTGFLTKESEEAA